MLTRKTVIKKKKRGSIKISIHAKNCEKLFCLQSHHQGGSLPAHSTSGYQQSNYPSGTTALSAGFQLNFLVEALSTISRHDDYKCVARILCEMASGKLPGRSLGKRGSGLLEFLGRTVFTEYVFLARIFIDRIFSRDRSFHDVSLSFVLFLFQLAGENRRRWHVSVVDLRKSHDPWIQQSRKFRTVLSSVPKVSEGYERVGSLLE